MEFPEQLKARMLEVYASWEKAKDNEQERATTLMAWVGKLVHEYR